MYRPILNAQSCLPVASTVLTALSLGIFGCSEPANPSESIGASNDGTAAASSDDDDDDDNGTGTGDPSSGSDASATSSTSTTSNTSTPSSTTDDPTGDTGSSFECILPELPEANALTEEDLKLPDPFTFFDGTPVTTKEQWDCRRKEILAMAAKYLYGPVPGDCDEVSGSVTGGNVSISCTVGGNTENFSASISGSGEVIALNLASGIIPGGGKSLSFGSGFEGRIRNLYGLSELNPNIANGWMINRVMDVLEQNPNSGHDPTKMVVSGCSGCGKGAFLAGVFSRVPMTVIVESGGGGGTSWRMTQWYRSGNGNWQCGDLPQGIDNLEDNGICGPWVTSAAAPFRSNPQMVNRMPFDQHLLLATIAPRYLVHFTNNNGPNSWCHLAGTSEALAAWAAYPVYRALGVPENMAFEVYSGGHCGVGDTGIAAAMFDRAFNGNTSAATGGVNIQDGRVQMPVSQWPEMWIDWNMETVLQ